MEYSTHFQLNYSTECMQVVWNIILHQASNNTISWPNDIHVLTLHLSNDRSYFHTFLWKSFPASCLACSRFTGSRPLRRKKADCWILCWQNVFDGGQLFIFFAISILSVRGKETQRTKRWYCITPLMFPHLLNTNKYIVNAWNESFLKINLFEYGFVYSAQIAQKGKGSTVNFIFKR